MEEDMESTEEKDLKKIRDDFTKAIKLFKGEKFGEAKKSFAKIVNKYKESPYTSIMQVQMRSNVYKEFIDFKLSEKNSEPKNNEDILNQALLYLNKGKLEKAESYFNLLEGKRDTTAYFYYLSAILNVKKGENDKAIELLKTSVEKDEKLKINAFNESDFSSLKDDKEFQDIVS